MNSYISESFFFIKSNKIVYNAWNWKADMFQLPPVY